MFKYKTMLTDLREHGSLSSDITYGQMRSAAG